MGEQKRGLVMEPSFMHRIKVESDEEARKATIITGKNISKFYATLYSLFYGGKVKADSREDIDSTETQPSHWFNPDIVKITPNGREYTEIKATSTKNSRHHFSFRQTQNYCFALLSRIDKGDKLPCVDYGFFRYGLYYTKHLYKLNKNQLVKMLSKETKSLTIAPLNLALFLFHCSILDVRDHSSSGSSIDDPKYKRSTYNLTTLINKDENAIDKLCIENGSEETEDLFLKKLKREVTKSKPVIIEYYGGRYTIKPFPITKYYLPEKDYASWLKHFSKNHKGILDNLGLEDLFHKQEELNKQREKLGDPF